MNKKVCCYLNPECNDEVSKESCEYYEEGSCCPVFDKEEPVIGKEIAEFLEDILENGVDDYETSIHMCPGNRIGDGGDW